MRAQSPSSAWQPTMRVSAQVFTADIRSRLHEGTLGLIS